MVVLDFQKDDLGSYPSRCGQLSHLLPQHSFDNLHRDKYNHAKAYNDPYVGRRGFNYSEGIPYGGQLDQKGNQCEFP